MLRVHGNGDPLRIARARGRRPRPLARRDRQTFRVYEHVVVRGAADDSPCLRRYRSVASRHELDAARSWRCTANRANGWRDVALDVDGLGAALRCVRRRTPPCHCDPGTSGRGAPLPGRGATLGLLLLAEPGGLGRRVVGGRVRYRPDRRNQLLGRTQGAGERQGPTLVTPNSVSPVTRTTTDRG